VAVEHADVSAVTALMFVAAGTAMVGAGLSARRSPAAADQHPHLWFAAGGMFFVAAAVSLLTHFIS
jgi:hypothetical protein